MPVAEKKGISTLKLLCCEFLLVPREATPPGGTIGGGRLRGICGVAKVFATGYATPGRVGSPNLSVRLVPAPVSSAGKWDSRLTG